MIAMREQRAFYHNGETFEFGFQRLFNEPRYNTGVAAAIAAIGLAASLAEYGYSAANQPQTPNLSQESAQMAQVQAELLPELRRLQAEEQLGGQATIPATAAQQKQTDQLTKQLTNLQSQLKTAQAGGSVKGGSFLGGRTGQAANPNQIAALEKQIANVQGRLDKIPKTQNVDFSGKGAADIQGQISKALAQGQLDTEKQFDSQFIASALAQEKLADPERFEARDMLYKDIQQQINNPPNSPVANEIQRQVQEKLNAGQNLTPEEKSMLGKAVQEGTAARGGGNPNVDFSQDLTTGTKGTQRETSNAGAGINWLSSGETPEDIQYRSEQQDLSNLSNYISGQTPQSQFGELSGAQRGSTPLAQAAPLPTTNPNAGAQGAAAGVTNYGLNVQQALNTPNPWMAGISGVIGGLNVAGAAGYKPFSGA